MDLVSSDNSALTKLYLRYRVPVVTGASGDGNGSGRAAEPRLVEGGVVVDVEAWEWCDTTTVLRRGSIHRVAR